MTIILFYILMENKFRDQYNACTPKSQFIYSQPLNPQKGDFGEELIIKLFPLGF